jgi:hypothetical protein|eukprot:scaffold3159_cov191-Alexandrium_tamarense.AAC.26
MLYTAVKEVANPHYHNADMLFFLEENLQLGVVSIRVNSTPTMSTRQSAQSSALSVRQHCMPVRKNECIHKEYNNSIVYGKIRLVNSFGVYCIFTN